MTPDYLRGYRDAVEEAARVVEAHSGTRSGWVRDVAKVAPVTAEIRALLPKAAEPTCARCGGTRFIAHDHRDDTDADPCPDCTKPETPLASMHHFKDGKVERMPMSTPPNPEAAPDTYLRGYRNGIEATRGGAVDSATVLQKPAPPCLGCNGVGQVCSSIGYATWVCFDCDGTGTKAPR